MPLTTTAGSAQKPVIAPPAPVALEALLPEEDTSIPPNPVNAHKDRYTQRERPHPPPPAAVLAAGESPERGLIRPSSSSSFNLDKFRTKMCHYYLVGKNCPFGGRCAFAHGEEQLNTPLPPAALERVLANQQQQQRQVPGSSVEYVSGYTSAFRHAQSHGLLGMGSAACTSELPPFSPLRALGGGDLGSKPLPLSNANDSINSTASSRYTVHPNASIVSVNMPCQGQFEKNAMCGGAPASLHSASVTRVNSYNNNNNNNNNSPPKGTDRANTLPAGNTPSKATGTNANAASFVSCSMNMSLSLSAPALSIDAPLSAPLSPSSQSPPPSYVESTRQISRYGYGYKHFSNSGVRLCPSSSSPFPLCMGALGSYDKDDSGSYPSSPLEGLEGSGRFRYEPYSPHGFAVVA